MGVNHSVPKARALFATISPKERLNGNEQPTNHSPRAASISQRHSPKVRVRLSASIRPCAYSLLSLPPGAHICTVARTFRARLTYAKYHAAASRNKRHSRISIFIHGEQDFAAQERGDETTHNGMDKSGKSALQFSQIERANLHGIVMVSALERPLGENERISPRTRYIYVYERAVSLSLSLLAE